MDKLVDSLGGSVGEVCGVCGNDGDGNRIFLDIGIESFSRKQTIDEKKRHFRGV